MSVSIREALQKATAQLSGLPHAAPGLEAGILLSFALNKPRSHLHAWPDRPLTPEQEQAFRQLLAQRLRGEPIAYITGRREFWSLELTITPDTLIPRPETELLVERALALIPQTGTLRVADLGTGSGAIAAAIAHERPNCQVTATDQSIAALAVAKTNFRRLGLANADVCQGAWCDALPPGEALDLLLSNPPYIPENDPHLHQGDLPWEPQAALAAGPDGLDAIRQIINQAPAHLAPGGWLLLEHGYDQGPSVQALMEQAGFKHVRTRQDISGHDRLTEGQFTPAN